MQDLLLCPWTRWLWKKPRNSKGGESLCLPPLWEGLMCSPGAAHIQEEVMVLPPPQPEWIPLFSLLMPFVPLFHSTVYSKCWVLGTSSTDVIKIPAHRCFGPGDHT